MRSPFASPWARAGCALLRQLLTESVVLAVLAGAGGCLLATWGMQAIGKTLPPSAIPTGVPLKVDLHVFGFCLLLSIVTGLIFGASPAWGASKPDLHEGLSQTTRGAGRSAGRRLRSALVVTQLALSLVLLTGAILMVQAFTRVTRLDPGVRPQDILTFEISLPPTRYPTSEKTQQTFRRLLDGVGHLPGVRSAALATGLPYRGAGAVPFEVVGQAPARAGEQPRHPVGGGQSGLSEYHRAGAVERTRAEGKRRFPGAPWRRW